MYRSMWNKNEFISLSFTSLLVQKKNKFHGCYSRAPQVFSVFCSFAVKPTLPIWKLMHLLYRSDDFPYRQAWALLHVSIFITIFNFISNAELSASLIIFRFIKVSLICFLDLLVMPVIIGPSSILVSSCQSLSSPFSYRLIYLIGVVCLVMVGTLKVEACKTDHLV